MNLRATSHESNRATFAGLLDRLGFSIRGRRADCAYCEGRSRLTVSVGDEVAYCHRCGWTGNTCTVSRKLGIVIAPETREQREARTLAKEYAEWRGTCQRILNRQFHILYRKAALARNVLVRYSECEAAWTALKYFYDNEAQLCGALDILSCEKVSLWLRQPMSEDKLFRAFGEGQALHARHN